jgi:hypothetical protein
MKRASIASFVLMALAALSGVAGAADPPSQADIDICRQEAQVAVSSSSGPSPGVGPLMPPTRPLPGSTPSSGLSSPPTGATPSGPVLAPGRPAQTGDASARFQDAYAACLARRGGSR